MRVPAFLIVVFLQSSLNAQTYPSQGELIPGVKSIRIVGEGEEFVFDKKGRLVTEYYKAENEGLEYRYIYEDNKLIRKITIDSIYEIGNEYWIYGNGNVSYEYNSLGKIKKETNFYGEVYKDSTKVDEFFVIYDYDGKDRLLSRTKQKGKRLNIEKHSYSEYGDLMRDTVRHYRNYQIIHPRSIGEDYRVECCDSLKLEKLVISEFDSLYRKLSKKVYDPHKRLKKSFIWIYKGNKVVKERNKEVLRFDTNFTVKEYIYNENGSVIKEKVETNRLGKENKLLSRDITEYFYNAKGFIKKKKTVYFSMDKETNEIVKDKSYITRYKYRYY